MKQQLLYKNHEPIIQCESLRQNDVQIPQRKQKIISWGDESLLSAPHVDRGTLSKSVQKHFN
jgi:hypothetical protein